MTKEFYKLFEDLAIINKSIFDNPANSSAWVKLEYPYNHYKDENGFEILEFALAGFSKDQISVEVVDDCLYVSATVPIPEKSKIQKYLYHGIAKREMKTQWFLSGTHDKTKIKTKFENGLLTIMVPPKEKNQIKIEIE